MILMSAITVQSSSFAVPMRRISSVSSIPLANPTLAWSPLDKIPCFPNLGASKTSMDKTILQAENTSHKY